MSEDFQGQDEPDAVAGRNASVPAVAALLAVAVAAAVATVLMLKSCGKEEPVVVSEPPAAPAPLPPAHPEPAVDPAPVVTVPEEETAPAVAVSQPETPVPPLTPPPALPDLDESNELALKLLRDCVVRDLPPLPSDAGSLIRLFVVVVDNMAEGLSPRPHLRFLGFKDPYPVVERGGHLYADPAGYRRYDDIARAFAAMDAPACAAAYASVRPLVEEAYRDLGYPDISFDDTLYRALARIIDLEIPREDVLLLKGEGTFHYEDPSLEKLGSLERQIIRMGPENGRTVRKSLETLAAELFPN